MRPLATLLTVAILLSMAYSTMCQCSGSPNPQTTPLPLTSFRRSGANGSPAGVWTIGPSPFNTVVQSQNSDPTAFVSDFDGSLGQVVKGNIQVLTTSDDDFIGFVYGLTCIPAPPSTITSCGGPGLLFDWKRQDQAFCGASRAGTAVSRIADWSSVPTCDFWTHTNGLTELARGSNFGTTGWVANRRYSIVAAFTRTRLQIWIDQVLEFDLSGNFPQGRNGFYGNSQERVEYSDLEIVTATGTHTCTSDAVDYTYTFTYSGTACSAGAFSLLVTWDTADASEGTTTYTTPTTFSAGSGSFAISNVYNNPGGHIFSIQLFIGSVQQGPTFTDIALVRESVEAAITKGPANANCGFDSRCDAPTGTLLFSRSIGGTPGYTASWNDGDTTCCSSPPCSACDLQRTVGPGLYQATLTDSNLCSDISNSVVITGSQVSRATIVQPACGNLNLTPEGNCGPFTYLWSTTDGNGLTPTAQNQSGLSGGTYSVVVTDQNGCTRSASYTIGIQISAPAPYDVVFMYVPTLYSWGGFQTGTTGTVFIEHQLTGERRDIFSGDVSATTSVTEALYAFTPGPCTVKFEATGVATCSTETPIYLCPNDVSLDGLCDRR